MEFAIAQIAESSFRFDLLLPLSWLLPCDQQMTGPSPLEPVMGAAQLKPKCEKFWTIPAAASRVEAGAFRALGCTRSPSSARTPKSASVLANDHRGPLGADREEMNVSVISRWEVSVHP
jgi:hypothetical protein